MRSNKINKLIYSMAVLITLSNTQVYALSQSPSDFTGDSFFTRPLINKKGELSPVEDDEEQDDKDSTINDPNKTIPPIKLLRLKLKAHRYAKLEKEKEQEKEKNANDKITTPTQEDVTVDNIDNVDNIEYYETDDLIKTKNKRKEQEKTQKESQIVIDCKHMDYATDTGMIIATGNVLVTFPQNNTTLNADFLTFDKNSNRMHAEGNVVINNNGQETLGDSIDIDLNEESMFIENPLCETQKIKIRAEEGFLQRNLITQKKGSMYIDDTNTIDAIINNGPDVRYYMRQMNIPKDKKTTLLGNRKSNVIIKIGELDIDSCKDLDTIKIKDLKIVSNDKVLFKKKNLKMYSNKGRDFLEGNLMEIGSRSLLGAFIGPSWAFKLPRNSVLKIAPILTYKRGIGVGGLTRYSSPTNKTQLAYGSSNSRFVMYGSQALDDNLSLEYAMNDYMDEWFLGRRLPKHGISMQYKKQYPSKHIFGKNLPTTYEHNASIGYFHDMTNSGDQYISEFNCPGNIGTARARYMNRLTQRLYNFNKDKNSDIKSYIDAIFEGSTALYGTGDSQLIFNFTPHWNLNYKNKWVHDLGYRISAYSDETPMPIYDAYRYSHSSIYLREYVQLAKYFGLAWQGSVALSKNSTLNNSLFQECMFFGSFGPDDVKLNIGYDFVRDYSFINLALLLETRGTQIDFDKLVIKNPDNFDKLRKENEALYKAAHVYDDIKLKKLKNKNNESALTKAIVTEVKEELDDI